MTVVSSPMNARNTHHVKLSDGIADVGLILCDPNGVENERAFSSDPVQRSSIKFYQGEQALSDLEPPWQDVVIGDFSGGRGAEKYEADTSKYWDSRQVDTTNGGIILGPMEQWDKGTALKKHATYWPGVGSGYYDYDLYPLYGSTRYVAASFTVSSNYTCEYIYFWAKVVGDTNITMPVTIRNNSSGNPGTIVNIERSVTITPELRLYWVKPTDSLLAASGTYWIRFDGTANGSASNYVAVVCDGAGSGEKVSSDGTNWSSGTRGKPYFRVEEAGTDFRAHFAETKGILFCGAEYEDGSTSKVFMCGSGGVATAAAAGYIRDSNNTLITDDVYNGAILRLFSGTGAHVPSPYRTISDTATTNSQISVSPNFGVTPSTDTRYVVLGSDRWTEVTGHGLAANNYITDALGTHGAIYWALGSAVDMKRMIHNYSAGYFQWATETNNKYTFLKALVDGITAEIWGANRTLPSTVAKASAVDVTGGSGSALSFGSAINVGDLGEKITGLQVYGETMPMLYVFKEGSIYYLDNEIPKDMRISGLKYAADERNGYASAVHDVYLFFTFLDSVERYFRGSLDDVGPNRDGGLPYDRRGMISSFLPYPGLLYATMDGGRDNYSSIIGWNGQGWHEVWRTPAPVDSGSQPRIYGKLHVQPIQTDSYDRMYFSWNGNIISLPVHPNPFNLNSDGTGTDYGAYMYCPGGSLETGWIHLGLEGVDKLFNSVTIFGKNLSSTNSRVFVDYKLDDDTAWTVAGQVTITNDTGEVLLDSATYNLTGKRIRLRVRLETTVSNSSPKIDAIVLEALAVVPGKRRIELTFRAEDYAKDLIGQPDDYTDADSKIAQLRTWAASAGTIAMSGHIDELNGLRVKLDYPSVRIVKHEPAEIKYKQRNRFVCQLGAWVID